MSPLFGRSNGHGFHVSDTNLGCGQNNPPTSRYDGTIRYVHFFNTCILTNINMCILLLFMNGYLKRVIYTIKHLVFDILNHGFELKHLTCDFVAGEKCPTYHKSLGSIIKMQTMTLKLMG